MRILGPDTVRNDHLLHVDVHKAGLPEPFLQLGSWTDLIAGQLECAIDLVVVPTESGAVDTAVFRDWIAVPILEFDPAAGLD